MGIPVFLFEMGSGQFSSEGPIKIWNICPLFQGIGFGMLMLSLYIGIYYNILISWSFFYLFSSFTSSLPWASCDNAWNTEACGRAVDRNCSLAGGLVTGDGLCVQPGNVSREEWDRLNQTNNNAKMPSDEFFQ